MLTRTIHSIQSSLFMWLSLVLLCFIACKRPISPKTNNSDLTETATEADSPPAIAESSLPAEAKASVVAANCGDGSFNILPLLREIAQHISADSVWYDKDNPRNMADCSGIFHRFLDSLKVRCPEADYPTRQSRSTRDLAQWYDSKQQLQVISDPIADAESLQPGAIIFYGGRGAVADGVPTIDELIRPGGINHVGVVIRVKRDAAGIITNYHLFHGRWVGKMAGITKWHKREPGRAGYPPYGNGREPWVAVARFF